MNWEQLFSMQQQLDQYIQSNHNLKTSELFEKKILALLVELGELANETRCFKFWSHKNASERSIILEEYVDGLHFILSIGLDLNYHKEEIAVMTVDLELTELFNLVYSSIIALQQDQTSDNYKNLFGLFLALGEKLGYSEQEIKNAYDDKNQVNFTRQDTQY